MIKFFRKIRQNLLSKNKFSRYLIYAIGEIILVVIGILIALQIGDLNEKRKKAEQGTIQKAALKVEMQNDLESLKLDLEYLNTELKRNNSYAERLSNINSNLDTLVKIVRYEYIAGFNDIRQLNKTTFNSLESTGEIDLLGEDLAKKVTNYYIDRENDIEAMNINSQIYYNMLEPFMFKYPGNMHMIQGHLQGLYWKNVNKTTLYGEFNGLLTVRIFNLKVRKRLVEQLIAKTERLIGAIN